MKRDENGDLAVIPADSGVGGAVLPAQGGTGRAVEREPEPARPRLRVPAPWIAFLLVFTGTVAQRPVRAFHYDALIYWTGARALFDGRSVYQEGWLHSRGALTPLVYAPAGLVDRLAGGTAAGAVLVENALIIAALGAFLLPRIARQFGARHPAGLWICAVLVWFVAGRFARYPLMDIPAAALFLVVVVLALRRSWLTLAAAGVLAGVTFNLRPAYLLPLGVVLVAVALRHRWRAPVLVAGAVAGVLPQLLVNLRHGTGFSFTPAIAADLLKLQLGYSPFVVRYDTVLTGGAPQQFYCDATMARAVSGDPVTSTSQLVGTVAGHLPYSAAFLLKKLATAFAWSDATPYGLPAGPENPVATLPILALTVLGTLAVLLVARRHRNTHAWLAAGAVLAVCASLATSTPETRFAVPAVLLAIPGCALLPELFTARATVVRFSAAAVALTLTLTAFAVWGLSDAMPRGIVTAESCPAHRSQIVMVLDPD